MDADAAPALKYLAEAIHIGLVQGGIPDLSRLTRVFHDGVDQVS